jgi:hypothetical protein
MNGEKSLAHVSKDDPVLSASLTSFRNNRDIDEEIQTSLLLYVVCNTLGLSYLVIIL